ncbi:Pollen Ole e 1 allergen/extensin [Macleaya cordata]|uniref:Pollen Ole e 1 allergen/extensin n=1 Tax=Macleaya cordata TaxID=56857 RepID=A0A200QWS4_MACCD|nr:Pollen Ole e 1 allergen/extensin [Macleaya cordata]
MGSISSTRTVVRSEFDDVDGVVKESDEMTISTMMSETLAAARVGSSPAPSPGPGPGPAPAPAPGPSSHLPLRSLVAVQGVVYCKPCNHQGVGAVVRLECNNSRNPIREETKTDKNGYFLLQASKKISNYGAHKCNMFLVSSPLSTCNKPTDLHMGLSGSYLIREKKQPPSLSTLPTPYTLYSIRGPFAFDSTACPRH